MKLAKYQAGMGFISWTFMLILIAFLGAFVIKLAPVYIENFSIRSILHGLETEAGQFNDVEDIRQAIARRFNVNNIDKVQASDVIIEPLSGNSYAVRLDYERRVPFIHNISFVVDFSETAEVRAGGALPE